MTVTRRDFLRSVTVGGVAVGSTGLAKAPTERALPFAKTVTKIKPDTLYHVSFNSEVLAKEAANILADNMVLGNLVYRDHFNEEHLYGDVINIRRPVNFTTRRADPSVLDEDAHKQIHLDIHLSSTSWVDESHFADSFDEFVELHVRPGMMGFARTIDDKLMWSMRNACSHHVTDVNERVVILDARQQLNENLAFMFNRHMLIPQKWHISKETGYTQTRRKLEAAAMKVDGKHSVLGFDLWKTDCKEALAFHRESIGLVNRPILTPIPRGARTFVASREHDLSMRCTMIRDAHTTLTKVILETLFGTCLLASELICTASLRN